MLDPQAPMEGDEFAGLPVTPEQTDWLAIAKEAYESSTDYLDANYRKQWEKNVANFRSEHPSGSKYHSEAYRLRSRHFRPKTRSAVRKAEATFAQAMFSTSEVVTVSPVDQTDKDEDKAAEVWQAVLNHRLQNSIPWFLLAVGAYQEASVYGVVVSRQDWELQEKRVVQVDGLTGEEFAELVPVVSRPRCKLIEAENFRFDPASDWTDPINTSPYLIEVMPMFVGDVLDYMADPQKGWIQLRAGELLAAGRGVDQAGDSTRAAREGGRTDPKDLTHRVEEFGVVWIHRNIVRRNGEDWEYYTLGTNRLLSEPVPLDSPIGRPYKAGITCLEAHRAIPAGAVELGQGLQAEANDIVNQRRDNVRLALNRGWRVTRNRGTDLQALKRSYPGRIVMTDDPNSIQPDDVRDVTASAYAEEDRVNTDMDDILGGFSAGSVASNRKLNETVGGMQMIHQSGNAITEYSVRTFIETWVEPVLKDLVALIQMHEDPALVEKFALNKGADVSRLNKDLRVSVSVGFGALDPKAKVQQMTQALQVMAAIAPQTAGMADAKAIARELFGVIGYRDGSKFYHQLPEEPPEPQPSPDLMLKEKALALKEQELIMKGQIEMAKLQMNREAEAIRLEVERQMKMSELALKQEITLQQLYANLDLNMDRLNLDILREMSRREEITDRRTEQQLRAQGRFGVDTI